MPFLDDCLQHFTTALDELGMEADVIGQGGGNRFDPGFELDNIQKFEFGDLRKDLDDRIVIIEMESGGGLTNLVKYWPLAANSSQTIPILLLHIFGQASANDYISHLKLWDFTWNEMRKNLWGAQEPKLFARRYCVDKKNPAPGLLEPTRAFTQCLAEPLTEVCRDVFSFRENRTTST